MNVPLTPIPHGQNVGLTLHMTPLQAVVETTTEPCAPTVTGLFWFSDESGAFDAVAESAYLMPNGEPAGPVAAVAKLAGETCGQAIEWDQEWTPDDEGAPGPPLYFAIDRSLLVYVDGDTAPGTLSVTATCGGTEYGPITLTFINYNCDCSEPNVTALKWSDGSTSINRPSSPDSGDEDEVILDGGLIFDGEIWPDDCTIEWTTEEIAPQFGTFSLDYVLTVSPDSPTVHLVSTRTASPTLVGTLKITASVTCCQGEVGYGPFSIYYNQLPPT